MKYNLNLEFELDRMLYDLIDNNDNVLKVLEGIFGDPLNGIYHIMFLHRLNIKGKRLLKLYENSCDSNNYLLLLTIKMMEKATFSLTDINDNLDLEAPIPFVNDITDEVLEPIFFNKLDEHKDFLNQEYNIFKKKLEEAKTSKTK